MLERTAAAMRDKAARIVSCPVPTPRPEAPPRQHATHRQHLAALHRRVAGELRQALLPFSRAQQIKEGAGGGLVERGLEAGEEIRLLDQRHEIQPAAARAGLDAEAGVGLPARHRLRDRGVKSVRSRAPGDLYCKVVVETPVNLTPEQREMLEKFEATFSGDEALA